jgi:integrase
MNKTTTAELKELQELIAAGRAPKPARDGEIKWHPKISGLGLRLYNSGNGTWVVQYRNENGRTKRHKGGNAAVTNLRFAEDWGKRVLRQVGGGEDPQDTRESARTKPSLTLRKLIDLYFEAQVVLIAHRAQNALSPKTLYTYRQLAKHHLVELAQLQADEITPKQITRRIKAVDQNGKHPALAQHFRAMLGSVYRWAMDDPEFDIDANPVKASWRPMTKEQSGEALTMEELGAIWRACEKLATVPPRFKGNPWGAAAPVAAKSVRADDTLISLREAERQTGITKPILDRAVKAGELKVILRRDLRTPEDPIKIKQGYHRRTYLITAGELRRFAATRSPLMRSPQFEYSIIIRLLILLGGRYSEMGGLRRSELEKLDAGVLHIKTKTAEGHRRIKSKRGKKKDLTIYLPQVAIDLIKSVPETPGRDCLFGNGRTELTSTGKGTGLLQNH